MPASFPARWLVFFIGLFACLTALTTPAQPEPKLTLPFLSPVFADHMVLQRDKLNRFWGWTEPSRTVSVEINGKSASSTAGADGKWVVTLPVPPAGGPYTVKISGPQTILLTDVLVGDVWLCGGQSNMAISLSYSTGGAEAARTATRGDIRFCTVATRNAYVPAPVPVCEWKPCTPKTAEQFSAVAYYFARRLQEDIHVPDRLDSSRLRGQPRRIVDERGEPDQTR